MKKLKQVEMEKGSVEGSRNELKVTIGQLEHEVEALHKDLSIERKKLDELDHERALLSKLRTQAEKASLSQADIIKVNENSKRTIVQELQSYKVEAAKQAKQVVQLEKDRQK